MSPSTQPDGNEDRLLDLLDAWQQGRDSGREPSPDELCPDNPTLCELLREHIGAAKALEPASAVGTNGPGDASTDSDLPPAPPGYQILRELGRGGMGVVYEAVQTRLNRPVALKMVRGGSGGTSGARFLAEAEAVAAARHPNVVQVYESGERGGRAFLVMEYLAGGTLAERLLKAGRMPARAAAELVAKLARGVQAAHARQIVHRDLKPGNVLFDDAGEPKVTDFGLAKHADRDDLTATGVVLGSPAYMAPEQADGRAKFVAQGADVYALGVVLYECLTGKRPFEARTPAALVRLVVEADPQPPRRREPSVPRDVELICLKCLAKDPAERYATAKELADDLDNFGAGRPVSARPVRWPVRLTKWVRRNKLAAALIVTALVGAGASSAFAAFALDEKGRADREAGDAKGARDDAENKKKDAQGQAVRADREAGEAKANAAATRKLFGGAAVTEGIRRGDQGDESLALLWLAEGLRRNPDDAAFEADTRARWAAYWHLSRRFRLAAVSVLDTPPVTNGLVSLAPNGRRILTGLPSGGLRLWDAATGAAVGAPITHKGFRYHEYTPDGKRVLTIGDDQTVRLWNTDTGAPFGVPIAPGHEIASATVASDGVAVLVVDDRDDGPRGRTWRADTGKPLGPTVRTGAQHPAVSPDGTRALGTDGEKAARVFDMTTGKPVGPKFAHEAAVLGFAFSPDGTRVSTADLQTVWVWDPATGKSVTPQPLRFLTEAEIPVFSPDGRKLLGMTLEGPAQLWDVTTGQPIGQPLRHGSWDSVVLNAQFSPDGRLVVTTGMDNVAELWDAATGLPAGPPLHHTGLVTGAAFTADSRQVVVVGGDNAVRVFDAALADPPAEALLRGSAGIVGWTVALHPAGTSAAVSQNDGGRLIDLRTRQPVGAVVPNLALSEPFAFSRDGTRLFTAELDGTVRAWDTATGGAVGVPVRAAVGASGVSVSANGGRAVVHGDNVGAAVTDVATGGAVGPAFVREGSHQSLLSGDGALFASCGEDGTVRVRDAATGKDVSSYRHQGLASAVAFSPDGKRVASGGWDRTARVWDAATGQPVGPPLRHSHDVGTVAFSPDGNRLLTLSKVTAMVWDARTGEAVTAPMTAPVPFGGAAFSRDGRLVITEGGRAVRLWDAATGQPVTPPLDHPYFPHAAVLTADGKRLISADGRGIWSWNLARAAPATTDDVVAWSEVYTAARLTVGGREAGLTPEEVRVRFDRLRAKYPDHFGPPTAAHVGRWHADRAADAASAGDWYAAAAHLRTLLARQPADKELAARLKTAEERHKAGPEPDPE